MSPRISIVSLLLPTLLAAHGLSKKSLSPSGALTAFFVGFLMISGSLKIFGVYGKITALQNRLLTTSSSLVGFYLLGSRATKYGKQKKAKLEAGYHDYGNRSGWQVLSNSFSAAVACTAWNIFFLPQGVHAWIWGALTAGALKVPSTIARTYTSDAWCPLSKDVGDGWSRALLFAALGHFACCLGDTLASELGILSSSPPRLITTGKTVPPGTNGGVSVGGTLASFAGGVTMGVMMSVCLIIENSACRSAWFSLSRDLVIWGGLGGVGGSALDSLLGATIQMTRYDDERKLVVEGEEGKRISGWDILTNNQVNVVSSLCCAVIIARLA
ncbi:Integral membrane family protein [Mycena venus]|uniref:Integral membrane family protein n=1 Tax=Mycena venus TaxID=2733690 RepID=A0A8H6Y1Y7_9AGAR|nr:Integral membrane family protein [Mycena venus]